MCIDMCIDMCTDTCIDMCTDTCPDMCTQTCVQTCVQECVQTCVHRHMYTDICTDMCVEDASPVAANEDHSLMTTTPSIHSLTRSSASATDAMNVYVSASADRSAPLHRTEKPRPVITGATPWMTIVVRISISTCTHLHSKPTNQYKHVHTHERTHACAYACVYACVYTRVN